MSGARLVLVYNAEAGIVAGLMDSIHKLVSPATYPCSLCAVTYGAVAMHARWRDFLRTLPYPTEFYHRPDFRAAFPAAADTPLPLIALAHSDRIVPLLDAVALDAAISLDDLIAALEIRLRDQQVE